MKIRNLSVAILLLLVSAKGYSQTEKGTFVLSGKTDLNFMFSNSTVVKDSIGEVGKMKNEQYGFTIGSGYFIADNVLIAVSAAYSYNYNEIDPNIYYSSGAKNITSTLAVIPQLSYYFPLEGKLRPSLSIGAGYILSRERDARVSVNNNMVYSLSGPSYNGAAGLSYFITRSVAFDLGLQYSHNRLMDKARKDEIEKQNIVAGTLGVSIFF